MLQSERLDATRSVAMIATGSDHRLAMREGSRRSAVIDAFRA
jgi:hypothetical protein